MEPSSHLEGLNPVSLIGFLLHALESQTSDLQQNQNSFRDGGTWQMQYILCIPVYLFKS